SRRAHRLRLLDRRRDRRTSIPIASAAQPYRAGALRPIGVPRGARELLRRVPIDPRRSLLGPPHARVGHGRARLRLDDRLRPPGRGAWGVARTATFSTRASLASLIGDMSVHMTGSPIWALLLIAGTVLLIVVAGVLLVVRSPGARWKLGLAVLALALAAFLAAFRVDTVVEQPHSEVHQIARPVPMKRSDVGDAADGFPGRVHPSAARSEATTVAERDGASLLIRSGRIETRQDHADWQRGATAISFRSPSSESPAPEWVGNAADASLRDERVGDTTFRIWKPGPRGELAAYSTMEATAELAIDAARAE